MHKNIIVRFLEITVILSVFAFYTLRYLILEKVHILGKFLRTSGARIKCFLEGKLGRNKV